MIHEILQIVQQAQAGRLDMAGKPANEEHIHKGANKGHQPNKGKGGKQYIQPTHHKPETKWQTNPSTVDDTSWAKVVRGKGTASSPSTLDDNSWTKVVRGKGKAKIRALKETAWPAGSIMTDNLLRQQLEEGKAPTAKVAWVRTPAFAQQCCDLATLHNINTPFALITTDEQTDAKQMHFAITDGKQRHQLQKMYMKALSTELPELPTEPVLSSTHTPQETKLIIFRVSIPKAFVSKDRWHTIQQGPHEALTALITPHELHSSYGWCTTIQGTKDNNAEILDGYIRVTEAGATEIQTNNGKGAIFAKPLTNQQSQLCSQPIQWLKKEPDDTEQQYFSKSSGWHTAHKGDNTPTHSNSMATHKSTNVVP